MVPCPHMDTLMLEHSVCYGQSVMSKEVRIPFGFWSGEALLSIFRSHSHCPHEHWRPPAEWGSPQRKCSSAHPPRSPKTLKSKFQNFHLNVFVTTFFWEKTFRWARFGCCIEKCKPLKEITAEFGWKHAGPHLETHPLQLGIFPGVVWESHPHSSCLSSCMRYSTADSLYLIWLSAIKILLIKCKKKIVGPLFIAHLHTHLNKLIHQSLVAIDPLFPPGPFSFFYWPRHCLETLQALYTCYCSRAPLDSVHQKSICKGNFWESNIVLVVLSRCTQWILWMS